jgi:rhodanese-related sulfurtransferase
MTTVASMTPVEFVDRWPDHWNASEVVLLDVREPHEISLASVEGSLWIPMGQIPSRLDEIDRGKTIVVMCHGGVRSLQVAVFLSQRGFGNVVNLDGGIDAWSRNIDPKIPRY